VDSLSDLDRRLAALCRQRGPIRAALARLAAELVRRRAWERFPYARLSDYAAERLGLSGRSMRSLATVGKRLGESAGLEAALVSGALGWTKVRLLARLPPEEDDAPWIAWAGRVTAQELSKAVRKVDRPSMEDDDELGATSQLFGVHCTPEVRWKWHLAHEAASQSAGRKLQVFEAAELIAAEVASALSIDESAEREAGACDEAEIAWGRDGEPRADGFGPDEVGPPSGPPEVRDESGGSGVRSAGQCRDRGGDVRMPAPVQALLDEITEADAFELDARMRGALSLERRLDARIAPLLALTWVRFVHRALGHATREAYARERLGMDPTRARALVRLERAATRSEAFADAWRTGALSWVKAGVLAPIVSADPLGDFVDSWVAWAQRVTVRRLRSDVDYAVTVAETDPAAFRSSGGLPAEARTSGAGDAEHRAGDDREIGAGSNRPANAGRAGRDQDGEDRDTEAPDDEGLPMDDADDADGPPRHREIGAWPTWPEDKGQSRRDQDRDRGIGAAPRRRRKEEEACWTFFAGPPDVVDLFRSVVYTVRRRMGQESGRLPTAGQALEVMLDHALASWGALDSSVARRHRVFARDGWRCAAPGCTSMQNLHDHHIEFRSTGGGNELENRVTLCAFHHLRGVHAGLLKCVGRAPDGLWWEMGIRPGAAPLAAYRSGDLEVPAVASPGRAASSRSSAPSRLGARRSGWAAARAS